ncbi:hypothetical protein NDU88_009403 [Pleurodeles waltl]|uniref:C-type lectin domain-containing protein n=1 Tax=Pleurodeles waltl TaxID=8319 RepID=A0AAV7PZB9_PLEWA|nr:hypothetical protein NDU88_009403 [Pleurodeles waltl]
MYVVDLTTAALWKMPEESPYQDLEFQDRVIYSVLNTPAVNDAPSGDSTASKDIKSLERKLLIWRIITTTVSLLIVLIITLGVVIFLTQCNTEDSNDLHGTQQLQHLQESVCFYTENRCRYCPANWLQHSENCYYFIVDQMNWTDSQDQCKRMLSQLVVIKSQQEQIFLSQRIHGITWIGLSKNERGLFIWEDETILINETAFWQNGQPDNKFANEDCVEMNSAGWNDSGCRRERFSICKQIAAILYS